MAFDFESTQFLSKLLRRHSSSEAATDDQLMSELGPT